jgi:hypothetical protein
LTNDQAKNAQNFHGRIPHASSRSRGGGRKGLVSIDCFYAKEKRRRPSPNRQGFDDENLHEKKKASSQMSAISEVKSNKTKLFFVIGSPKIREPKVTLKKLRMILPRALFARSTSGQKNKNQLTGE